MNRSRFERAWLLPAWGLLGLSRAAVLTVPFRRLAPLMGQHNGPFPVIPLLSPGQILRARQISRTVTMAARFTPWTSNCFAQALTAGLLSRLYAVPYSLHFGLARGDAKKPLLAHAWVTAGGVRMTGGDSFSTFTVVSCFVHGLRPEKISQ